MPSHKGKMPLDQAQLLANALAKILGDTCLRADIAGSIRREEPTVGDIEIVCLAEIYHLQTSMFGEMKSDRLPRTKVDDLVSNNALKLSAEGWTTGHKNGLRHKQLMHTYREQTVADLYIVTDPRAYGSTLCTRTGPWWFSKALMTRAINLGMHFSDGFLLHNHRLKCAEGSQCSNIIPLPEEKDVFAALQIQYVAPRNRKAGIRAL